MSINEFFMLASGIAFVGFWAYLAWDSHKDLKSKT